MPATTGGTMVLRLDDTDVERNTEASVQSIFEGLRWLGLDWDEEYKQSERLALHRRRRSHLRQGPRLSRLHPAHSEGRAVLRARRMALQPRHARTVPRGKRPPRRRRRALRPPLSRPPRPEPHPELYRCRRRASTDEVKTSRKLQTDEVEDFASCCSASDGACPPITRLLRRRRRSRISHIIRGQDHLTNTFKHLLIFEALGAPPPQFAHLPLLVAPDGAKLSKRKHGPVVSVTTYRDAGFLPQAFVNFLCLLGWSPKNDREFMTLDELTAAFTLEGVNRANAVINFSETALSPDSI
jgi:glutamyl-tRNA synthetase